MTKPIHKPNQLSRVVARMEKLPGALRRAAITAAFTYRVKFAGTGGIRFEELQEGRSVLRIHNRKKVQNHIGGVHAAAMALLAETATGAVLGMSIPDTHIPLLKSMHINYVRRAQGDLRAEATLDASQQQAIRTQQKGDVAVPVKVIDSNGDEPIQCEFVWAWVPKRR
jgi:uncharacterized protein (TIGR00369 family)